MKEILQQIFRPTVAAVVLRPVDGVYQFGSHISARAYAENPHTTDRCTVQGGIQDGETPRMAMFRELAEEYGSSFAQAAQITAVNTEPTFHLPKHGKPKMYHWFWVAVPSGLEPEPNEEVHRFFWDYYEDWLRALGFMSTARAQTVSTLTRPLAPIS